MLQVENLEFVLFQLSHSMLASLPMNMLSAHCAAVHVVCLKM